MKTMQTTEAYLVMAVIIIWCYAAMDAAMLTKPYTIRIPFMAPIGGTVQPLGMVCKTGIELIADAVNSQTKILQNYNVVFDVYDDRCTDYIGVERIMTYYAKSLSKPVSPITEIHGDFMIPSADRNNLTSRDTTILPPLLIGSICSGVCKVTSRFTPQLNVIDAVFGCNDPSIDRHRREYRNLFRFLPSLAKYATARVDFAKSMSWKKVAIITDSMQYSLMDTYNLMQQLQAASIEILAEEFYFDDPGEAVQRLKLSGARIFFANCYVNTCPFVACSAYQEGLFGPKYVWIFKPDVNLASTQLKRPNWCSERMMLTVAERTLYIGADVVGDAYVNSTNELGISYKWYREQLVKRQPDVQNLQMYSWRTACIESAHLSVYVLDSVEKLLNSQYNRTIRDYYSGDVNVAKLPKLVELIRAATRQIDVRSLVGRQVLEKDDNDSEPIYPIMVVNQLQEGVRQLVISYERSYNDYDRQLMPPGGIYNTTKMLVYRHFIWSTRDGQPPKSYSAIVSVQRHVPSALINAAWFVTCLIILACLLALAIQLKQKNCSELEKAFLHLTDSILVGVIIFVSSIFFFPLSYDIVTMDVFCKVAPAMAIIGSTLMTTPLVCKLFLIFLQDDKPVLCRKTVLRTAVIFPSWFLANLVVLALWYADGRPFAWQNSIEYHNSGELADDDVSYAEHWLQCSLGNEYNTYNCTILSMQALFLLFGIIISLVTKNQANQHLRAARACLFIIVPSLIVTVLLTVVVPLRGDVAFGLVAFFCGATCWFVLTAQFSTKRVIYAVHVSRFYFTAQTTGPIAEGGTTAGSPIPLTTLAQ